MRRRVTSAARINGNDFADITHKTGKHLQHSLESPDAINAKLRFAHQSVTPGISQNGARALSDNARTPTRPRGFSAVIITTSSAKPDAMSCAHRLEGRLR